MNQRRPRTPMKDWGQRGRTNSMKQAERVARTTYSRPEGRTGRAVILKHIATARSLKKVHSVDSFECAIML